MPCDEGVADILWLPGARDDTARIYQCLDVFVLPSLNEGISNTLLEAMATGLPVIASSVGGNVELVADRATGRLIAPADSALLATELSAYIEDEQLRIHHGAAGRERALAHFSIEAMVDSYTRLYDATCSRAK